MSRQSESRGARTRRANQREDLQTMFQGKLYIPPHRVPKDMEWRWIRAATLERPDNSHMSDKLRSGWTPVARERLADIFPIFDIPGVVQTNTSVIAEGGLVLCEMPKAEFNRRQDAMQRHNRKVMEGIAWQQQGLGGAPTFDNSSKVQIERVVMDTEPEFQDE